MNMRMPQKKPVHPVISADQLNYGWRGEGSDRHVYAHHPDYGVVGLLSLGTHQQEKTNWGKSQGLATSLAFVHPGARRQGVASTLYNIASHQLGYQPEHDEVRTKEGNAWAQSTGGHIRPPSRNPFVARAARMASWEAPPHRMAEIQAPNWEASEKIEPRTARALTPYEEPKKKAIPKKKRPEQLALDLGDV